MPHNLYRLFRESLPEFTDERGARFPFRYSVFDHPQPGPEGEYYNTAILEPALPVVRRRAPDRVGYVRRQVICAGRATRPELSAGMARAITAFLYAQGTMIATGPPDRDGAPGVFHGETLEPIVFLKFTDIHEPYLLPDTGTGYYDSVVTFHAHYQA